MIVSHQSSSKFVKESVINRCGERCMYTLYVCFYVIKAWPIVYRTREVSEHRFLCARGTTENNVRGINGRSCIWNEAIAAYVR